LIELNKKFKYEATFKENQSDDAKD
jgi:hypothetical protein